MKCALLGLALTACLCASAWAAECTLPGKGGDWSMASEDGVSIAYRAMPDGLNAGKFLTIDLRVCGADGAFPSGPPRLQATMPMHGHGTNYDPVVKTVEPGRYRVDGLLLHMTGKWRLSFRVPFGSATRRLATDVQVGR